VFGTFELPDAGLETGNGLAEELRACFAFAIVILAEVLLLGTHTLLAGRLCAIAALWEGDVNETAKNGRKRTNHHFSLPAKGIRWVVPEEERGIQTCTEDMLYLFGEWGRNVGLGSPNNPRSL